MLGAGGVVAETTGAVRMVGCSANEERFLLARIARRGGSSRFARKTAGIFRGGGGESCGMTDETILRGEFGRAVTRVLYVSELKRVKTKCLSSIFLRAKLTAIGVLRSGPERPRTCSGSLTTRAESNGLNGSARATSIDRTLFFDFLLLNLGIVRGFKT
jgi:hypothetical protein